LQTRRWFIEIKKKNFMEKELQIGSIVLIKFQDLANQPRVYMVITDTNDKAKISARYYNDITGKFEEITLPEECFKLVF